MTTPTANANVTTTITATPALIANISELCNAQSTLEGKWLSAADECKASATKQGYTREQIRPMIVHAYTETANKLAKSQKLDGDAAKNWIAQFLASKAPDVSKIMALAYPATEQAAKALADARAHNAAGAKGTSKVGVNDLLTIARDKEGKTTVETVLQKRAEKTAAKGAQNGGAPRIPGATPTPTTMSKDDVRKALAHTYTQARSIAKLSEDEIDAMMAEIVTEFNAAIAK